MWRTAFGRPVVPELNTSTASASTSSMTGPGSPAAGGVASSSERTGADGSAAAERGAPGLVAEHELRATTTAQACCTSVAFHAGLNITTAAPSCRAP